MIENREIISIVAGVLVLIAIIPKDKPIFFRLFNMTGSAVFVLYGILLVLGGGKTGYALATLNVICMVISIVYLLKYFRNRKKNNENSKKDNK